MNKSPGHNSRMQTLFSLILLVGIVYQFFSILRPLLPGFVSPYYTESVYKSLEDAFNHSQYRIKNPTALIPDETVFSYAAGAYLHGVDPILINSEHTPLGKYILAAFIFFFKNDKLAIPLFGAFSLFVIWLVSRRVLGNSFIALVPVFLFSIEPLFVNQFTYTPLLDVIQLPFIYAALYYFLVESKKNYFWMTGVMLGFVIATKTVVPGILLVVACSGALLLYKKYSAVLRLSYSFILSLIIFIASYAKTFLDGYSFVDFIGFQKWIFLYQKSRLLYPFSVWRLIYLNKWQTWWGDFAEIQANDWTVLWPILFTLGFVAIGYAYIHRKNISIDVIVLLLWISIYEIFLSLGVVVSRFFLPLLPALYIVAVYLTREVIQSIILHKHSQIKKVVRAEKST